jgi:hypothetical protein
MLLCDVCDKGYHLFCLKPPLKEIPTELWCCSSCATAKDKLKQTEENEMLSITDAIKKAFSYGTDDPHQKRNAAMKSAQKIANKIYGSLSPIFSPTDIKSWATRCISSAHQTDFTRIREDRIASNTESSIFTSLPSVEEKKYTQHFSGLLMAVDMAVDKVIKGNSKPSPLTATVTSTSTSKAKEKKQKKKRKANEPRDGPRSWIFQANSKFYDIDTSVRKLKRMTWFIKQHIYKIKAGDKAYIWVSGKDGTVFCKLELTQHSWHHCVCYSVDRSYRDA